MEIRREESGGELVLFLEGNLDASSAPALQAELDKGMPGVRRLIFDLAGMGYLTSAGLRVILNGLQIMDESEGEMVLRHVNEEVRDILKVTGFEDLLVIE